jgi:hypothetical protein
MEQHLAMKRIALALALALLPSAAWAQCTGVFPPNTLCGNPTGVAAPPSAFLYSGSLIGPGSSTANGLPIWSNTAGTILKDGNGQTIAGNYGWSGAQNFTVTDPIGLGPNQRQAFQISSTYDNNITSNPGFVFNNALEVDNTSFFGDYNFGSLTNSKSTFINVNFNAVHYGAGQHDVYGMNMTCYGKGDCSIGQQFVTFANFPSAGDEGTGWSLASRLSQLSPTALATVTSTSKNTCNTTLTQAVTGSATQQTVTVASGTGCTANTWIIVNREQATGFTNHEGVQIISSTAGSITAIFRANYNNGMTITPALDMITNGGGPPGQGRLLVNISATPYTTGTIASISGGSLTGSGTGWTVGMVGGDTTNPGCLTMAADDYSSSPFGAGSNTLHSYFQIYNFVDATHLAIFSFSSAGSTAYGGKGPGAGAYRVLPCSEVVRIVSSGEIILADSNFTWTNGQTIEYAIPPYPDVSGFQYYADTYTNGGTYRSLMSLGNNGARKFQNGLVVGCIFGPICGGGASPPAGVDSNLFTVGIYVQGGDTGLCVSCLGGYLLPTFAAVQMAWPPGGGLSGSQYDPATKILWGGSALWIQSTYNNGGTLELQMAPGATPNGKLASFISGCVSCGGWTGPATSPLLQWSGMFSPGPAGSGTLTFGQVATCSAALQGAMVNISDSTSGFWGQPAAGFGSFKALIRCDGSNWITIGATVGAYTFLTQPVAFASLPTCVGGFEGILANVNNSNTATWGATVAGGGTNHIQARCNGTNWTVVGA